MTQQEESNQGQILARNLEGNDQELIVLQDERADREADFFYPEKKTQDFTDELILETNNICPVTGLPYSTPNLTERLKTLASQEILQNKKLLFFQVEVDRMKKLNDDLGHAGANRAMKMYFASMRRAFSEVLPDVTVAFYRPRAGGDKVRVMVSTDRQSSDEVFQKCMSIFNKHYHYQQEANAAEEIPEGSVVITASVGSSQDGREDLYENPDLLVDTLEAQARDEIATKKLLLIEQETLARFAKLRSDGKVFENATEEVEALTTLFVDIVAKEWGAIRLSENNLYGLLMFIFARLIKVGMSPSKRNTGALMPNPQGLQAVSPTPIETTVQTQSTPEELLDVPHEPSEHELTETLISKTKNVCPVTQLPFEVPESRPIVGTFIETALIEEREVQFFQIDLDKLSQMNANLDMPRADRLIYEHFTKMRNYLHTVKGIDFMMYRPQAGGDEMMFAVTFDPSLFSKQATERLLTRLTKIFNFSFSKIVFINDAGIGEYFPITGSVGRAGSDEILEKKQLDSAMGLLQEMETISEARLKEDKLKKADGRVQQKTATVLQGDVVEQFLHVVAKEWGSTRLGENALRICLEYVRARMMVYIFKGQTNGYSSSGQYGGVGK